MPPLLFCDAYPQVVYSVPPETGLWYKKEGIFHVRVGRENLQLAGPSR